MMRGTAPPHDDTLESAKALIPALSDLVIALRRVPGPIWDYLIASHRALKHEEKDHPPTKACVPCAFNAVLDAAANTDPLVRRDNDPTEPIPRPDVTAAIEGLTALFPWTATNPAPKLISEPDATEPFYDLVHGPAPKEAI